MLTLQALEDLVVWLWQQGDRWARFFIAFILGWPVVIRLFGIIVAPNVENPRLWSGLVGMMPIVFLILAASRISPLLIAAAGAILHGWAALSYLLGIFGFELLFGIFFAAVPTWNDVGLIPLTITAGITAIILSVSPLPGARTIGRLLLALIVFLIVIFFLGGSDRAARRLDEAMADPTPRPLPVVTLGCARDEWEEIPDILNARGGFVIVPAGSCLRPVVLVPTDRNFTTRPDKWVQTQWNFVDMTTQWVWDAPGLRHKPDKWARGLRFRNTGERTRGGPVKIYIFPN
jgi:hypothetical protein